MTEEKESEEEGERTPAVPGSGVSPSGPAVEVPPAPAAVGVGVWARLRERRAGFARRFGTPIVFLLALGFLLPTLDYGLWDPWETHYAEVARRITVDNDWITLHWGSADSAPSDVHKDFLFFSKPILTFWLMALSFLAFGVSEFAARLPMVLLAAGAVAGVFHYLRRLAGDGAALLSSAVLLTTPMWVMLGRHAMTDIPFVAPMTVGTLAFAAVLLDPRTSPRHAYVGYVCLALATLAKGLLGFLLPGAMLLAMLFVIGDLRRIRVAGAELGAGADGLREWLGGAWRFVLRRGDRPAARRELWVWLAAAGICIVLVVGSALAVRLRFGPSGGRWGALLAGALLAVVAVLRANGERWKRLNLPLGIPLFLLLCATWYVPVILRNGMPFVREFFLLHHFGRASSGIGLDLTGLDIHEGTAGYYLQQLGYAFFPWILALPAAVVAWARHAMGAGAPAEAADVEPDAAKDRSTSGALLVLALAWAVVPYVLFTTSEVKFHHYIFPVVPALAILVGVGGSRLVGRGLGRWEAAGLLFGAVFLVLAWRELAQDPNRLLRLFSYRYTRRFPIDEGIRGALLFVLVLAALGALGALATAWWRSRRREPEAPGRVERFGPVWLGGFLLAAAFRLTLAAGFVQVPELSRWISQRDAFAALAAAPAQPGDRFVSWANNWRGEVFYSQDRVTVIEPGDKRAESKLRGLLRRPGRLLFVTTDVGGLRAAVVRAAGAAAGRDHFRVLTKEGSGGFDAAVYDGPVAGAYEPRVASLPANVRPPAGAGAGEVVLREPRGGGRLALVGVRFDPPRVRRGELLTVDLAFRCDGRASRDWDVFIHIDAPPPSRKPRVGNGDHGFTGGAVATSACRRGELLLDRWELEVATGATGGAYQVFAGMWHPPSGERMRVEPAGAARSPGGESEAPAEEFIDRVYLGDVVVTQ